MTVTPFDTVDDWTRTRKKWNNWKRRDKGLVDLVPFHQADGSVVVVHSSVHKDDIGDALPAEEEALLELVTTLCERPSLEVRNRSSAGFGGEWQGTRGNGPLKQAEREGKKKPDSWQLKTNAFVSRVSKALAIELNARSKGRRDLHCVDTYVLLRDWQDMERVKGKNYTARPWREEYWDIIDFIESHTRFRLKDRLTHKMNSLFHRPLWRKKP